MPVYAPAWEYGGPILSVSRLCEALVAKGHRVQVLTTNKGVTTLRNSELGRPILRNGVEVTYFKADQKAAYIYSKELEHRLPEIINNADILHLSTIWQPLGIPIQRAAYQLSIPVLQSPRGALSPYSRFHKWWKKFPYYILKERQWIQRSSGLHATTRQEKSELEKLRLKPPIYELANPINLEQLYPEPQAGIKWKARYDIKQDVPVLLICGRQHHKKGLDLLESVFNQIKDMKWVLLMVGNDDDGSGKQLVDNLKVLGLDNRLISLGSQPAANLRPIYNAADLLLLPSRHENFGNVVVEALSCGCSVLVSDKTGVGAELVENAPRNFGSVLPRDAVIWTEWLKEWFKKPKRAGDLSARWAARRYKADYLADQATQIYSQITDCFYS